MSLLVAFPVKDAAAAKSRLAPLLPPRARHELALRLHAQAQAFFRRHYPHAARLVVTPSPAMAGRAEASGAQVLLEPAAEGLDAAARRGLRWARERGHDRLLWVPVDIAVWRRAEIDRLLADGLQHDVVIAPAADGGTNALLLDLRVVHHFEFAFGSGSAEAHARACRRAGLRGTLRRLPALSRDVDTTADYAGLVPGTLRWRAPEALACD